MPPHIIRHCVRPTSANYSPICIPYTLQAPGKHTHPHRTQFSITIEDFARPFHQSQFVFVFSSLFHFNYPESHQGPHEKRLLNTLLGNYNTLERPVSNETEALSVRFGLTLQQIIDVVSAEY